ncbi:MAG: hypothetical protein AAGD32_05475 [Planctomycetota bacterium]
MAWTDILRKRLGQAFGLYGDLVESIPPDALMHKLPGLASNTIGEQFWCVVGARESYARAIRSGQWEGFACSLQDVSDPGTVADALRGSANAVMDALGEGAELDSARIELALALLEHESAHHGQLIRYLYGLRLPIPPSWKARYALD